MTNKEFMDIGTLSEYLNLSTSTLYKKVHNKTIPFLKIGSRTLFDKVEIDKWVRRGGQMADSELPNLPLL
jgi:excisionase family DNA binding protein